VEKMSKSYNNYIGIVDQPKEMFGKTLSIPDELIYPYFELATDISNKELIKIKQQLDEKIVNPRDLKRHLAKVLIRMYHNKDAAEEAEKEFDKIFVQKEIPDDIPEIKIEHETEIGILDLIVNVNFAPSKGEARRLVIQGGVSIDGEKINDINAQIKINKPIVLKVGKRKFIKIIS
jgi:tyrosyl-tRNA synthetase